MKQQMAKIQEQQIGFVNRWSGVRFPRPAPRKTNHFRAFAAFPLSGKGGRSGAEQRFQQPQKPERSFTGCSA
jgi:hypothetical protein